MSNLIDPKKVFVVVPAFNEDRVIRQVVTGLINMNYTVVLVDDGSDTPVISQLDGLPVHILRHPVNLGQGAALQTGIEYALSKNADHIISFDADGQHQAADLPKLLAPLINNERLAASAFFSASISRLIALLQAARCRERRSLGSQFPLRQRRVGIVLEVIGGRQPISVASG